MKLELFGGPLSGKVHEVAAHRAIPTSIGFLHGGQRHWYLVDVQEEEAVYMHSEDDLGPQRGPRSVEAIQAENKAISKELGWWICAKCKCSRPPILKGNIPGVCKICLRSQG